ncbi:MAG: type II toxin-antitoxin system HipA family toxin [Candidatus Nanopelagicales bacterium]
MNADLRRVDRAHVWKQDRRAGQLARHGSIVTFAYEEGYDGPAVATSLPVGSEPVVAAAGAVPAFFAGLLPEGRRLTALHRALKTSADDELTLLMAVGGDPVGDVRILPADVDVPQPEPIVRWDPRETVDFSELAGDVIDRKALAGVQDKVSAAMITLPAQAAGREAILKLTPPEYPHLVDNEAYFLGLAARAGLTVPRFQVVHDLRGEPGLLVERFDRVGTQRRAVEDAAQVMGLYPAQKYAVTMEQVSLALMAPCRARPVAARDLFRMVVFAWLTGNGDLHAKNLAILDVDGEWRISPVYDVPSSLPYGDTTSALTVAGRDHDLSRRSLLDFADALSLTAKAAVVVLDHLLEATQEVIAVWSDAEIEFTRPRNHEVLRHLRARRRALAAS